MLSTYKWNQTLVTQHQSACWCGHSTQVRIHLSPILSMLSWYNDKRLEDRSCWFGKKIRLLPNDVNDYRYETPSEFRVLGFRRQSVIYHMLAIWIPEAQSGKQKSDPQLHAWPTMFQLFLYSPSPRERRTWLISSYTSTLLPALVHGPFPCPECTSVRALLLLFYLQLIHKHNNITTTWTHKQRLLSLYVPKQKENNIGESSFLLDYLFIPSFKNSHFWVKSGQLLLHNSIIICVVRRSETVFFLTAWW